ncbi:MAG: lipid IV(A) 3-deoxy-D-manno-octulosonic acid transferase [Halieaceae bacterium]|jgi:3-deoxy-D-manno-octulosonic-acid transferase|nr:lipid IV(A) 3-deoxy-D-manno-octulosonic acid transferase [Halieaceae bacterium]
MRLFYSALYYCLLPLLVLRLLWRSRRAPAYRRRLAERFGCFPGRGPDAAPAIWVHAVSVGESLAAAPLVESLLLRFPDYPVVFTTTTPTGSERVRALFGGRVFHVYAPWDLPGSLGRFLRRTRPRLLVIMETELWPNMLHRARAAGCDILLANARLSERSASGYARLPGLTRQMLGKVSTFACQSQADSERFLALGASPSALQVTGNTKFDLVLDDRLRAAAAQLRQRFSAGDRPVLVAASTHPGEEQLILAAYRRIRDALGDCLLVLVPRHPERFAEVYALCTGQGWQVLRRSGGGSPGAADDILLGDTMGELLLLLGTATVAVFGGSLLGHGGHNVLEAAAWGVPAVTGPHMENFAGVSDLLCDEGALVRLDSAAGLDACLLELLADPARRQRMGLAGIRVVAANRGASARLLELVSRQLAGD